MHTARLAFGSSTAPGARAWPGSWGKPCIGSGRMEKGGHSHIQARFDKEGATGRSGFAW